MEVYSLMTPGFGLRGIYSSLQKALEAAYYLEVEICAHGWRIGIPEMIWYHYGVFWDGYFKDDWVTLPNSWNINTPPQSAYQIMAQQIDQFYPPPKYLAELQGYTVTLTLPSQDALFSITENKPR